VDSNPGSVSGLAGGEHVLAKRHVKQRRTGVRARVDRQVGRRGGWVEGSANRRPDDTAGDRTDDQDPAGGGRSPNGGGELCQQCGRADHWQAFTMNLAVVEFMLRPAPFFARA
jgi:hypothetical protein